MVFDFGVQLRLIMHFEIINLQNKILMVNSKVDDV